MSQVDQAERIIQNAGPEVGGFDTETTGLNIKYDRPFVFVCGFLSTDGKSGTTFAVDLQKTPAIAAKFIPMWYRYAANFKKYFAHNVKFDLHMMKNAGFEYNVNNVSDTMFYIRHGMDHIPERFGGPSLKLKVFASQYISRSALQYEKNLKKDLAKIAKFYNLKLMTRLKPYGAPPAKYSAKSYTMSVIEDMFKDCTFEIEDLPEDIRQEYSDWFTLDLPLFLQKCVHGLVETDDIPYTQADRNILIQYAHWDVIFMLETFDKLAPIVKNRDTINAIEIEERLIYPFLRMEATGFKIDVEYLEECRIKIRQYIRKQRQELFNLAGREFKVGQHALIKDMLNSDFDLNTESVGDEELQLLKNNLIIAHEKPDAVKFITLLQELKTLEKWYGVYILRFQNQLHGSNYIYTQINQVGAVSGRVSSDFQQFPRDGIKDINGEILFLPRKIVLAEGNGFDRHYCIDYSQIELRIQAIYTILVGSPDLNLCRAYMPYQCINSVGVEFDYKNPLHVLHWNDTWFLKEAPTERWVPTDVHAATTKIALGIDEKDPMFNKQRSTVGKRVNFAKNYGAGWGRMRQMFPEKTPEEITQINDSYYTAFPGVKNYHDYCYGRAEQFSNTQNLFGIMYYNTTGHKLINLLIQGSAAFLLKLKIIAIDEYIQTHKLKTRLQMQIHDELMIMCANGEDLHMRQIQSIMEKWEDTYVPIVAEAKVFDTNWADKKGVNLDDVQISS